MMIAGGKSKLAKAREETKFLENAFLLRDFWFVGHPEASMPPVAGTPGSTFFRCLPGILSNRPGGFVPTRLGMRDNV